MERERAIVLISLNYSDHRGRENSTNIVSLGLCFCCAYAIVEGWQKLQEIW